MSHPNMNKADYKVEGYLIRAREVFIDYIKTVRGTEVDQSMIKTKTIIDIAQMIQREENPPVYVIGNQIASTGLHTYVYSDEYGLIEVTAPDFEAAIPMVIKKIKDLGTEVTETMVRANLTRME